MVHTSQPSVRYVSLVLLIVMLVMSLAPVSPASAQSMSQPGSMLAPVALTIIEVTAPDINLKFDNDGFITVNDTVTNFTPSGATGSAFLQSRLWPQGQPDTSGYLKYPYLYRVDLRNAASQSPNAPACITSLQIPFGPVSPVTYITGKLADVFVITTGGIGSVKPSAASYDAASGYVSFSFLSATGASTLCAGASSFFFGLSSAFPPQPANAILLPVTTPTPLEVRAPFSKYVAGTCINTLAGPGDIPSPALINFDSVDTSGGAQSIETAYQGNYGVTFDKGVNATSLTMPIDPPSKPNTAISDSIQTPLGFTFGTQVTHVGFYGINPTDNNVSVTASALDINNREVCSKSTRMDPKTSNNFFGFYDPDQRIMRVTFTVVTQNAAPQIDDLNFAPGTVKANEFPHPSIPLEGGGPEIITRDLTNTHFGATFNLPDPSLWFEKGDNINYLHFGLPGVELYGNGDGYPDIPIVRRLIAYPEGATLKLTNVSPTGASEVIAPLYPSQKPALDDIAPPDPKTFENPPFVINADIYNSTDSAFFYPNQVADVQSLGKMRDLNLALVTVYAGRYNPFRKQLQIFKSVDIDISFEGGAATFLTNQSFDPFEPNVDKYYGQLLNSSILSLSQYIDPGKIKPICGTEYYIVTPPALLPAAQSLATWKISKGISTQVVQFAAPPTGIGTTKEQVKAFLQTKYDTCLVRPSYLLILGDAELIPPWSYPTYGTNSDLDYATMSGAGDYLPDLAYGRIPVDTLQQANTVVSKIIAYEKFPPTLADFYKNFTFASYFECCSSTTGGLGTDSRSFVETSEIARAALTAAGKTVNRIYTADLPGGVTPARYYNGAPLPASIGPGSGFSWTGSTANIVSAINAGSGLVFHRDHGWPGGWWKPGFDTTSLDSLTNGSLTPVLYSVNCASGLWDNELGGGGMGLAASDVTWAEKALRMNGGAVSVIGDMRNSPTWANSALSRGLFDATWPNTDPTYGSGTVHRRLGDILNYAKLYMLAQVYIPQSAGSVSMDQYRLDNLLYHVIGDPTLELWTGYPYKLVLPPKAVITLITLPLQTASATTAIQVEYPVEGATITALQNGLPVGRAVVSGGKAIITIELDTFDPAKPTTYSASMDDSIGVLLNDSLRVYLPSVAR